MRRSRARWIAPCVAAAVCLAPAGATGAITPLNTKRTATGLAEAISAQRGLVTRAWFATVPPTGRPAEVATTRLAGFPRPTPSDGSYAILSTGDATLAGTRNTSTYLGRENGGPSIRGAFDVVILRIDVRVPSGHSCLSFDARLLSDEYREAIGTAYGDVFLAELGVSNWEVLTAPAPGVVAPFNLATTGGGALMTITKDGFSAMSPAASAGTTYDGATGIVRVAAPIAPGSRTLYLSIFDRGDHLYDSSVFVDNLRTRAGGACATRVLG